MRGSEQAARNVENRRRLDATRRNDLQNQQRLRRRLLCMDSKPHSSTLPEVVNCAGQTTLQPSTTKHSFCGKWRRGTVISPPQQVYKTNEKRPARGSSQDERKKSDDGKTSGETYDKNERPKITSALAFIFCARLFSAEKRINAILSHPRLIGEAEGNTDTTTFQNRNNLTSDAKGEKKKKKVPSRTL